MSSKTKIKKRWKPTIGAPLGPQEQKIMKALDGKSAQPVWLLFRAAVAKGRPSGGKIAMRTMQQRIGAIVARLNKKLKGRRIVAGDVARTYRIRRVR